MRACTLFLSRLLIALMPVMILSIGVTDASPKAKKSPLKVEKKVESSPIVGEADESDAEEEDADDDVEEAPSPKKGKEPAPSKSKSEKNKKKSEKDEQKFWKGFAKPKISTTTGTTCQRLR
jgi:hypothetical protein